jgi:hypothetical protein
VRPLGALRQEKCDQAAGTPIKQENCSAQKPVALRTGRGNRKIPENAPVADKIDPERENEHEHQAKRNGAEQMRAEKSSGVETEERAGDRK